jgi:hypothetical protein
LEARIDVLVRAGRLRGSFGAGIIGFGATRPTEVDTSQARTRVKHVLISCAVLLVGTPLAALAKNALSPAQAQAVFDQCLKTCRKNQDDCNKLSSIPQYILACNQNFLQCANICSSTSFQ